MGFAAKRVMRTLRYVEHLGFPNCWLPSLGEHPLEKLQASILLKDSADLSTSQLLLGAAECVGGPASMSQPPYTITFLLVSNLVNNILAEHPCKVSNRCTSLFHPHPKPNNCQPSSFLLSVEVSCFRRPPRGSIFS